MIGRLSIALTFALVPAPVFATVPAAGAIVPPSHDVSDDAVRATIDALLVHDYPANAPGAVVIARRGGHTVLRKAYGMADLEMNVPLEPDMVFRIGSVSKPFTAAAVLALVDDGKVALTDPIGKFLPDYPAPGRNATVEQLLTHTSGIKNCMEKADFIGSDLRRDHTVTELIGRFKDDPMTFAPGTHYHYSNSGYILLGAIVQEVSGMPLGAFLKNRLFAAAGMTHTTIDDGARVVPGRARGYVQDRGVWRNEDWISMTAFFVAGDLISTVDDLAKWDEALNAGKVLRRETLQKAFSPHVLPNGTPVAYGYGWQVGRWDGLAVLQHPGSISGFSAMVVRVPEKKVYVAILSNRGGGDYGCFTRAQTVASYLMGAPWRPVRAVVDEATLADYAGVYAGEDEPTWTVTARDGRLYTHPGGELEREAVPMSSGEFFYDATLDRVRFERDAGGKVTALARDGFGRLPERLVRTGNAPRERKEVRLAPAQLDRCVGRYELAPGFVLTITREGDRLFVTATGNPPVEAFAESETEFFMRMPDAQLSFEIDGEAPAKGLVFHQGGQDVPAKRVD